jgi:hypothetical protein
MVSNLTANKRGSEKVDEMLNKAAEKCQNIKQQLVKGIDADTDAFNAYMEARRLPARTEEEKQVRELAMQEGLKQAVKVPFPRKGFPDPLLRNINVYPDTCSDPVGRIAFLRVFRVLWCLKLNERDICC